MSSDNNRNIGLSEIIRMLENNVTFTQAADSVLECITDSMDICDAVVMQIDRESDTMHVISETGNCFKDESGTVKRSEFVLCSDAIKITYEGNADTAQKGLLDRLGVKLSITVPILINNVKAMYLIVLSNDVQAVSDNKIKEYISDMALVLHGIAQSKVINNSLISSYDVLQKILDNIGSGIIVCSRYSGNILFENEMAANVQEVRDTIRECLEDVFTCEDVHRNIGASMERYNTESGLWFEVRFSELEWIDGSEVIVVTAVDITQKKKNQQKIEFQAHNDFLTGLYNRMKCESDLKTIINEAIRDGVKGAVLFIDLDDFKHINDGLGHQYGDILLQQIAAGLQSIVGLRGRCYRMGGDEFVAIVMPDMFLELERIANKVKEIFNKPWYLMETEYFCTMSMGIAVFPDDSKDVHEIIRMADIAMYESKKNGKNGYSFYDVCNKQNSVRRLDIENNMRQAVATGIDEFVVFYQPVVDINTEECASCEALVRWDSKSLGFMGPGDFIPLAEYLGLITSIGDYVLEEACRQCRYWNEHGMPDFHINVNLSVVQLLQKDIVDTVAKVLKKTGVNPRNIVLEITESFAINDMDRVLNIINGIRELGPKIALDDFGTGYSSLNYIKQLPFDIIKVDKTFIDDITEDEYAQAFIKLIVELSATIGTKIVVEGVEDKSQLDILRELGVDFIQGYYYGKPEPAYEFERLNFKGRINI